MADGEDDGEGLVGFWEFDFGGGAFGIAATVNEELKERAIGGEAEANGAPGEIVFLELEEVGPEMVGREVAPCREFVAEPFVEKTDGEGVVFESLRRRVFLGGHELDEGIDFGINQLTHSRDDTG